MIYKLVSIKSVIGRIVSDLGIGDQEIPWQDMVEWIGEALQHIGSYAQLTDKEEDIEIDIKNFGDQNNIKHISFDTGHITFSKISDDILRVIEGFLE